MKQEEYEGLPELPKPISKEFHFLMPTRHAIVFVYMPDQLREYAVRAVREATQWRPMETAPKDGTEVLLEFKKAKIIEIGNHFQGEWINREDAPLSLVYGERPYGWMPLPPLPEKK